LEYCDIKNKITEHVFETYPKPANYDFLLSLAKTIDEISHRRLEINIRCLDKQLASVRTRKFIKKLSKNNKRVCYNIAGTKTGRLTTTKSSFPILTLDKKYRGVIVPKNDWLLELDFNAAELRTFLALSQVKQPTEDIHEWNIKNVFCEDIDRDTAKTKAFAWLYNSKARNEKLEKVYRREEIMNKFWDGENVITIFNRKIPASKHHALNYIVQSTSSDLFLRRLVAINERLKGMNSFVTFSIHDSLVIDLDENERHVLSELVEIFQNTDLGNFKANVSVGKNFAEMRKIQ
jgi:DNA polymerase I-like protein with 3'-5' exonuclease and polymerase domains